MTGRARCNSAWSKVPLPAEVVCAKRIDLDGIDSALPSVHFWTILNNLRPQSRRWELHLAGKRGEGVVHNSDSRRRLPVYRACSKGCSPKPGFTPEILLRAKTRSASSVGSRALVTDVNLTVALRGWDLVRGRHANSSRPFPWPTRQARRRGIGRN